MKLPELKPISKAEFDALPNNKKAILLAKDVIALLDAGKFVPERGEYFCPKTESMELFREEPTWSILHKNAPAQQAIKSEDSVCHVCAKGSALAAYALRFNDMTNRQVALNACNSDEMTAIFGYMEWKRMEQHFEESKISIRKIMQRVIRNDGYYTAAYKPKKK